MKHIKKNDTVIIISGKSKGHVGKLLKFVTKDKTKRAIVEGGNLVSKHTKPNPHLNQNGGVNLIESPIDISNVAIYNPTTKKADKVAIKQELNANNVIVKTRVYKSNQQIVEESYTGSKS